MIAGIISFVRPDIAGVMSKSGRTRKSEWLPWHAEGREAYWPVVGYGVAYMQSSQIHVSLACPPNSEEPFTVVTTVENRSSQPMGLSMTKILL
jgi:hypothetical protein